MREEPEKPGNVVFTDFGKKRTAAATAGAATNAHGKSGCRLNAAAGAQRVDIMRERAKEILYGKRGNNWEYRENKRALKLPAMDQGKPIEFVRNAGYNGQAVHWPEDVINEIGASTLNESPVFKRILYELYNELFLQIDLAIEQDSGGRECVVIGVSNNEFSQIQNKISAMSAQAAQR